MKIKIGKGLSDIYFGMSEKEVRNICGEPDREYLDDYGNRHLQYNDSKVVYKFESEYGDILGWIQVGNAKADLLGVNLFGKPQADVVDFLTKELGEEPEIEDYQSFISVTYQNHWLELQFTFGEVSDINFGYLFDSDGNPIIHCSSS